MTTSRASLSLDLDDLWSYMKTHGDDNWRNFPSYLNIVVPRFLELLDEASIKITVFVVGQDAAFEKNHRALQSIVAAGHEIGNHSFHHEPWLHLYAPDELTTEIDTAEEAIFAATGVRPRGFRGPGYSLSEAVLRQLKARDYLYDCSTFPTIIGPLARGYYFARSRLAVDQKKKRMGLFGSVSDGFRPIRPYKWNLDGENLLEIPVTTMPVSRFPIHFSYLHWMAGASDTVAATYFSSSLRTCRLFGVMPSLLLHPLDFLGGDDVRELSFFPAMNQTSSEKMNRMRKYLSMLGTRFETEPMGVHADRLLKMDIPERQLDFKTVDQQQISAREEAIDRQ